MNDNASILLSIAPGLKNLLECCGLFTVKSVIPQSQEEFAVFIGMTLMLQE
jgi:hypothetical protein